MAVNVLGMQLAQPEFTESVTEVLRETGIDPARLCLEIPESALVADLDRIGRRLELLKGLGVTLAIDRFGATVTSALHALGRLPIDLIKFDRSFVLALGEGERSRALLEGLIALTHAMDIVPLAQGVQLDSEDAALRELGGDEAQGFRYSPPRPAEALEEVLGPGDARRRGRHGAIRVFLCDDIAEMRDMVRVALEQEPDFEVVGEASDGEGAARGVSETHPDVVLLDVSMPHVDGLEAIRRIRASGEDTAILVLSGFERQAMADTAIGLGADAYLEKRAALDEIRDTLRSVVTARAGVPSGRHARTGVPAHSGAGTGDAVAGVRPPGARPRRRSRSPSGKRTTGSRGRAGSTRATTPMRPVDEPQLAADRDRAARSRRTRRRPRGRTPCRGPRG